MRSCSSGSTAAYWRSSSPLRMSSEYDTLRSMRITLAKPHWRAMSVAFDDHGEIVPSRGTTSNCVPGGTCGDAGMAASRSTSRSRSSAASGAASSTKYQYSAASPLSFGSASAAERERRARREEESAAAPRSLRISAISIVAKGKVDANRVRRSEGRNYTRRPRVRPLRVPAPPPRATTCGAGATSAGPVLRFSRPPPRFRKPATIAERLLFSRA